jgi:hypothetical protein
MKEYQLPHKSHWLIFFALLLGTATAAASDSAAAARRQALTRSYGTYGANLRTPDGHIDAQRLLADLDELHANTYNWLIAGAATDWDDLQTFLPLARRHGIRVWVTVLPPSESPPKTKYFSEPFRLDYEKWAAELAALSAREPALVAWSVDDFAYNLKVFTPDRMGAIIAAQREKNANFAFVPCVYYKQANPGFANRYREFFDGILFPYRSESTKAGFADATQVAPEVKTLKERFGRDFPVIVDIYATRHSKLGASTPDYVEQVMKLSQPAADGVHIYRHQNKNNPNEHEKYDVIQRVMSSWPDGKQPTKSVPKE